MRFVIEKPKIRKGLSYVLKSSLLKQAIEETGLDFNIQLDFWSPQPIGSILSAEYWPSNQHVEYNRFFIRAGVVNSEDREKAQKLMTTIIIPELVKRIVIIKNQHINSTKLEPWLFFDAIYKRQKLILNGKEITIP